jgi:hypothetical protein
VSAHPVARYIPLLIAGDEDGLRDLFRGPPRINDPHVGWVQESRFDEFVANSHQGLRERGASVEHVTTTASRRGATEECVLHLVRFGNAVSLPIAIVSDTSPDARLESIRVYRSMWPLVGFHLVRTPVTILFSNGGGLGLEQCTIANEGASCALEYVVTRWGRSTVTHQAAAAVYEPADTGLLAGVRMYDDIEHPFLQN